MLGSLGGGCRGCMLCVRGLWLNCQCFQCPLFYAIMNKSFHLQDQLHLCRTSLPVLLVLLEVLLHLPTLSTIFLLSNIWFKRSPSVWVTRTLLLVGGQRGDGFFFSPAGFQGDEPVVETMSPSAASQVRRKSQAPPRPGWDSLAAGTTGIVETLASGDWEAVLVT